MILNKIRKAYHNPEIIGRYLKSGNKHEISQYLSVKQNRKKMLQACDFVDNLIKENMDNKKIIEITSKKIGLIKYPIAWYLLIRRYGPEKIIETGISMGWSSFMILNAIHRQKKGRLYSFDLGDSESVKRDGGVGYLVSDDLKNYWEVTLGDTKKYLEPTLNSIGQIDMFIHDSEHSYETMMFEYDVAWKHLRSGGILCSDDINHSKAFEEFVSLHKNEISGLYTFQEISRPSDDAHLRPAVGYFFKL